MFKGIQENGFLLTAPVASLQPENTVRNGRFVDGWPVEWKINGTVKFQLGDRMQYVDIVAKEPGFVDLDYTIGLTFMLGIQTADATMRLIFRRATFNGEKRIWIAKQYGPDLPAVLYTAGTGQWEEARIL